MLITLPQHDDTMEYLTAFSKDIIKEAENKSIKIKRLIREKITEENFEKLVKSLKYKLNVLNGHGSEDAIFGHNNKPILLAGKNHFLISDKITYARSCHSAISLGVQSMNNSEEGCFIGYNLPFMFFIDTTYSTNPSKDNTAKLFLEPSNLIPISIIKGNSTLEAHNHGKKQMLKNINKILKNKDEKSNAFAEALWNNYIGQTIIGNESLKLD